MSNLDGLDEPAIGEPASNDLGGNVDVGGAKKIQLIGWLGEKYLNEDGSRLEKRFKA